MAKVKGEKNPARSAVSGKVIKMKVKKSKKEKEVCIKLWVLSNVKWHCDH
jgi:hypothetical protein